MEKQNSYCELSIIIINWNSRDYLKNCIKSIIESSYKNYNIIVIDNNSDDNSLFKILEYHNIIIIKNDINKGFGAACNQGLKIAKSKYVLLLNPDAILKKNTLCESVLFMEKNKGISVLGIANLDENGVIQKTCARYPRLNRFFSDILGLPKIFPNIFYSATHMLDWNHKESMYVPHVIGAYYFARIEELEKVYFFDEDYFVYYEDIDLSYRISKNGGRIFFNSDIHLFHSGGGTSEQIKATRLYYSLHSRLIYAKKHFNLVEYTGLSFLTCTIEPFTRIGYSLMKGRFKEILETLQGYKMLYKKILF